MDYEKKIIQEFIFKQPFTVSHLLEKEDSVEIAKFFEHLPITDVARIFRKMSAKKSAEIITLLPKNKTKELIEREDVSHVSSVLLQTEPEIRERLLDNVSTNRLLDIELRLRQLPNTIGTLMRPSYAINQNTTVGDAEELLRNNTESNQTLIYVTDDDGILLGGVKSSDIFYMDNSISVEKIMTTNLPTFLNESSLRDILENEVWIENDQVAVVDSSGKFRGYLTHQILRENAFSPKDLDKVEIKKMGSAIGEIYRIGLSGLVQTVGETRESK